MEMSCYINWNHYHNICDFHTTQTLYIYASKGKANNMPGRHLLLSHLLCIMCEWDSPSSIFCKIRIVCVCVHDGKWLRGYLLCNRKHNAIYTYMDVKCKGICKICCCYSNVCNVIKASRRKCISIFAHIDACKIYCNKCILYFIKHFTFIVYNVERDSRQERYEKKNCIRILFIF